MTSLRRFIGEPDDSGRKTAISYTARPGLEHGRPIDANATCFSTATYRLGTSGQPMSSNGNCCGRTSALSCVPARSVGGSSTDHCRSRGRRAKRSRGCRPSASPRPGVHATQSRRSRRWHCWLHHDGYLRLCGNGVLSEPGPHMASSCDCSAPLVVCAQCNIGDLTHYGRRLARSLRSHDDACSRVGDLRNALTLARDHESPLQNPGA
jgi:hypothetical protein